MLVFYIPVQWCANLIANNIVTASMCVCALCARNVVAIDNQLILGLSFGVLPYR